MRTTDKGQRTRDQGRSGFTLIELLTVTGLLAVLMGLLSVAIWKARAKGAETSNKIDITQLDAALTQKFFNRYGFYPPSVIRLPETTAQFNAMSGSLLPLDQQSIVCLQRMFQRIDWNSPQPPAAPSWTGIDWDGNGLAAPGPVILYGDQCLVFFLGGIPGNVGGVATCKGFSTNPRDPSYPDAPTVERIGPFYDFKSSRLVSFRGNSYYSYADAYRKLPFPAPLTAPEQPQVYAYFSAYNRPNGYSPYGGSDCPGLRLSPLTTTYELFPYASAANQYLNPNTFQLISAGADGMFGGGSNPSVAPVPYWNATSASNMYSTQLPSTPTPPETGVYKDDQANFSPGTLQTSP